jgi:hypothetical protein
VSETLSFLTHLPFLILISILICIPLWSAVWAVKDAEEIWMPAGVIFHRNHVLYIERLQKIEEILKEYFKRELSDNHVNQN